MAKPKYKPAEIQHTHEPNLIEEIFDYANVPKIKFEGKIHEEIKGKLVTFDPADVLTRDIFVTDTTFRDGQQARPPYSVEQIVDLYDRMSALSGPNGVIRQSEFFLYTEKDRQALEACRNLGRRYPEITGWIRANMADFKLVKDMRLAESGMLTSCSDYHIFYKQRMNRQEALESYMDVVKASLEIGVRPRCHLEDVTRADIYGFVVPFVQKLMRLSEDLPEELKVKIRLCDTMGFGVTFPGAALPRSVPKLIWTMKNECGVPSPRLEWHGHNDFHKVLINATTAWLYGCDALNATLLGFGERTGNPPLEGAIMDYIGFKGDRNGVDTRMITEIARYFIDEIGWEVPANFPFVGADFNMTRAGIHAEGLSRDERIYNIFDTEKLLGRKPRVAITDKSGADGVCLWVNNWLGLEGEERLKKTRTARITRWVMDQYAEGRSTTISEEELVDQTRKHLPEHYEAVMAKRKGKPD
ncbi:MAG: 2-isopropylmalate synthase [Planctomycetota bacterium]